MTHHAHTREELATKIRGIYPEIEDYGLELGVSFSHEKDAWVVELEKEDHRLSTHLERKDANDCLDGIECVYLGVQIGQFIKNFSRVN